MVSVGSTNFDIRSFRLNDEASLNIYHSEFAKKMSAVYSEDLQHGEPYTYEQWCQRPWKQRMYEKFIQPIRSQL